MKTTVIDIFVKNRWRFSNRLSLYKLVTLSSALLAICGHFYNKGSIYCTVMQKMGYWIIPLSKKISNTMWLKVFITMVCYNNLMVHQPSPIYNRTYFFRGGWGGEPPLQMIFQFIQKIHLFQMEMQNILNTMCNFYHKHVLSCRIVKKYEKYNSTRLVLKSVENTKLSLSCMR